MRIDAPWDAATVKALNDYQSFGQFHPFICPVAHRPLSPVHLP